MKKIILASKSPRRAELLALMGFRFEVAGTDFDEGEITAGDPAELVRLIARAKAQRAAELFGGADTIIIAADTVVALGGSVLGKPSDCPEAKQMLLSLSGALHTVYTGLCVTDGGIVAENRTFSAAVQFREISEAEIDAYVATGEPLDKAGAYGIQERGAVFVEHVGGDFYAVVGLPVCALSVILRGLGIGPAFL